MDIIYSEYERINKSIQQITNFNQIAPTFKWIRIFEKFTGASDLANQLINNLTNITL